MEVSFDCLIPECILATIDSILSDPDDSYEGTDDADYKNQ